MGPVIEAERLTKRFGGMTAVNEASFIVEAGALLGVIGPNGSGKTTTLNILNGAIRPDGGVVRVNGKEMQGKASTAFVGAGVTRTFQNPRVFTTITALENLLVPGLHSKSRGVDWRHNAAELLAFEGL